jgi:hypothetical protein
MRKSRFMEEQIIGVLKQYEAGAKTEELWPAGWDQRDELLQMEGEVRRGVYFFPSELAAKQLGVLRELVPAATRVGVLYPMLQKSFFEP